jgi:hypothetical protein
MKRGIVALLTAVFLAGVGTARAYVPIDLVIDGGFDTHTLPSPDTGTSPWFTNEDGMGIRAKTDLYRSAPNALEWYLSQDDWVAQNLGVTVQIGEDYEVDLWHTISNPGAGANDSTFAVSIYTSTTLGGTYTLAAEKTGIVSAGTVGTWYNYTNTFTAAELAGVAGQYVQLRIGRTSVDNSHRLWIEDVRFGVSSEILAYFDTTFTSPDFAVADLTAAWTGSQTPRGDTSSTDGTFGTIGIPAAEAVSLGAIEVKNSSLVATLTLVNTNTTSLSLDNLHFDAARFYPNAPQDFVLATSGDITAVTLTNATGITSLGGKTGDFDDFDLTLTHLADHVLSPGEQVVFTWTFSNWVDSAPSVIDNVLVGGSVFETPVQYIPTSLVANGGFDGLSGSDPDVTTTNVGEWFVFHSGDDTYAVVTESTYYGNAAPSLRWKYKWNGASPSDPNYGIAQNLGVQVAASTDYEVMLSHAIVNNSGSVPVQFEVSLWTSSTVDGTYAQAVGLGNVYSTNATTGLFAPYEGTFNAASLTSYVGDYMQLRVTRTANGCDDHLLIDDVRLGVASEVLAYFDTTFTSPEFAVSNLTAAWTGASVPRTDTSSTDGTFGTIGLPSAEAVSLGAVEVKSSSLVATLTVSNTSDKAMHLDDIHFDAARFYPDAPQDFSLTTSGDITAATLINASGIVSLGGKTGDFDDFDLALTHLADNILNPGQQAVFTWTFSNYGAGTPATVIDNVLVGGTAREVVLPNVVPVVLVLNPVALQMPFTDATSILTNTFEGSYEEGYPVTNVNVSSVSVINDATGGFSVTPASFVLNDPMPSNQVVEVIFNNNDANLTPNQSEIADIQVVWNKIGSSVNSTSTVSVVANRAGFLEEDVIAAFHSTGAWRADSDGGGDADIAINGIVTVVSGLEFGNGSAGSSDGSYGTQFGDVQTLGGAGQIKTDYSDGKIYIALTNNTQSPVELDSLHFDYASKATAAPTDSITLTLDGDLGNGIVLASVSNLLNSSNGIVNYDDIDIDLSGLADLQDGEGIVLTFEYVGGDKGMIDNLAILGSGIAPAAMARIGYGSAATLGVSGLDLSVSQDIDLLYVEGQLETNIVVTGVSFANQDVPGAFSAVGPFPVTLTTPDVTNSAVFSLVFDNTVANLSAGGNASAEVIVEFDEPGGGSRTYTFDAVALRPADAPTGVIALFDTDFLVPDTAYNGVMSSLTEGYGKETSSNKGSDDGDYGSLVSPTAPVNNDTLKITGSNDVTSLTITNQSGANIDLSMLHFDIGVWWPGINDFTLSVSGDVTASNLLTSSITELGGGNGNYDDHDLDLTGLSDHTLEAGGSVTFTFTLETVDPGAEEVGVWIDNIALMGTSAGGGSDPIGDIALGGLIGGDLVFSWATSVGQTYNVETNADLTIQSGWGIQDTMIGDGLPVSVTNTTDQLQLFYKVTSP